MPSELTVPPDFLKPIESANDFTLLLPNGTAKAPAEDVELTALVSNPRDTTPERQFAVNTELAILSPNHPPGEGDPSPPDKRNGRALVCRAHSGQALSITMRCSKTPIPRATDPVTNSLNWFPQSSKADWTFPFPLHCYINALAPALLELCKVPIGSNGIETDTEFEPVDGLIIVCGQTNSVKSELTRALLATYLELLKRHSSARERTPHLVTIEDPIEKKLMGLDDRDPSKRYGIVYTPREIGKDTPSLDDALEDALRQTPAAVYVGETRRPEDWNTLHRFSRTGHLAITTTHASSIVEAWQAIFQATNSDSPAKRGQIASQVRAVIHMKRFALPAAGEKPAIDAVIPSMWVSTPSSIAGLVSDGLSSIKSQAPKPTGDYKLPSCAGKYPVWRRLTKLREDGLKESEKSWKTQDEQINALIKSEPDSQKRTELEDELRQHRETVKRIIQLNNALKVRSYDFGAKLFEHDLRSP